MSGPEAPSLASASPFTRAEMEAGRKLFAGDWQFAAAAGSAAALPRMRGVEVAVAGRSNVGKSSLINALTGRRALARTSHTPGRTQELIDRKSTRLNSSHLGSSYAVFCLKKKKGSVVLAERDGVGVGGVNEWPGVVVVGRKDEYGASGVIGGREGGVRPEGGGDVASRIH